VATLVIEQWTAVAAFLAAVLGLVGVIAHFGWRIAKAVIRLFNAVEDNTRAVDALTGRVDALESRPRRVPVRRAH
jgi:hypothetical protein